MSRIIPYPVLTALLVLMWILLTSFSLGHFLLGSAIALGSGRAMAALQPETPRIRNPRVIIRLLWVFFRDIVSSNITVTRQILTEGRNSTRKSAFIEIPLTLRSQSALAVLAIILTATPGTAWIEYLSESGTLILHVFDASDTEYYIAAVRDTYEPMLQEIFE